MELTNQERSAARAALIRAGVATRGMRDADLMAAAKEQEAGTPAPKPEWAGGDFDETKKIPPIKCEEIEAVLEENKTPTKEADKMPTPQDQNAAAAQIAQLITAMLPQQETSIDESRIVELIQEHATQTIEFKHHDSKEAIAIKGAHKQLPELVTWLNTGTNVYLTGPAGSGKTTLAEQAAKSLDVPFYSTGAIMASYELLGVRNAHGEYIETPLRKAYENGGVFLLDEIDGCSPKALICFNQLLANDTFCFPDGMVNKHADFVAVGGANTTGQGATRQYVGRSQLDAATLDRFVQIEIEYDEKLEARLARAEYERFGGDCRNTLNDWVTKVWDVREQLTKAKSTALVTPRATIHGARGLAKGLTVEQLTASILTKHLSDDQKAQLKGL